MKPHTYISMLRARQLNPIEESWDNQDQRSPHHGFVCRRCHGLCSFTGITLRVQAHTELALRVTMFNMVRQHTKLSSGTSIRGRTLASNDGNLTFHKSALMWQTFARAQLCTKWSYRHARHRKWNLIHVSPYSERASSILKRNLEIFKIEGRPTTDVQPAVNCQPSYCWKDS